MPLQCATVYRNIERRQEWLGLEPVDCFALGGLLWLLVIVNRHEMACNLLALIFLAALLRVIKRGKPENYLLALGRFYFLRRPFFSAAAHDTSGGDQ